MEIIVKSQETREGVKFRVLKDSKYLFVDVKFHNYFYIKTSDYDVYKDEFRKRFNSCIEKVEPVGQFSKIVLSNNFMRVQVRNWWEEKCPTYEADIKSNKRFLLDKSITLNNEHIPFTFFDIETDDRLPLQKDERGNVVPGAAKILAFSGVDHNGEDAYFQLEDYTDEAETKLLKEILNYFSKYGVISGWNSEGFDMPYIKGRCDSLHIDYTILEYINHLDFMELFKKYDKKSRKSYSLNNISNEILNESKIEQAKGNGAIFNTWKTNPEHLKRYNIEDSNLVYKINKKLSFIEVSMRRANNAKCHVRSTMNNSDSGDYLLMREFKAVNIIMPSQPTKEQVEERMKVGKISGGFTRCLEPGYHDKVEVWDYKSFYPMTIATFNISPETYVEYLSKGAKASDYPNYIVTPDNFNEETNTYHPRRVYRKKQGVIPKVCIRLIEERDKLKYTMGQYKESDPAKYRQMYLEQYAIKTDANSIYGILSFPYSRYYSWHLGDTVTTCCQAIIKKSYQKLEEWGQKVLGGDTDSTFVILQNATEKEIDAKFVEFYNEWFKEFNIDTHYIVFEHEKTVSPMLFVKKKNYAYREEHGDITIKGLEAIKADASVVGAQMQKDFIIDVMNKSVDEVAWRNKIDNLLYKVFQQELTAADLILVKALTKMPKDYQGEIIDKNTGLPKIKNDGTIQQKAIPAHVRLAERLINKGADLSPGSKIRYIVIADKPILAITESEYKLGTGEFPHRSKKTGDYTYTWEGTYEAAYYWKRIIKPIIKVVACYYNSLPEWSWGLTASQMKKIINVEEEDE